MKRALVIVLIAQVVSLASLLVGGLMKLSHSSLHGATFYTLGFWGSIIFSIISLLLALKVLKNNKL